MKFMVNHNVGKLVRWLRMLGYDSFFFKDDDDWQMIITALNEDSVLLTRDTRIMSRGVIASGRLKSVFIRSDDPEQQLRQVVDESKLNTRSKVFSRCLECNQPWKKEPGSR